MISDRYLSIIDSAVLRFTPINALVNRIASMMGGRIVAKACGGILCSTSYGGECGRSSCCQGIQCVYGNVTRRYAPYAGAPCYIECTTCEFQYSTGCSCTPFSCNCTPAC